MQQVSNIIKNLIAGIFLFIYYCINNNFRNKNTTDHGTALVVGILGVPGLLALAVLTLLKVI